MLYRLLFVLYAESRGLLPLENPEYRTQYSLEALATEIHNKLDDSSTVAYLRTDYWSRLQTLFILINKGWAEHIPQYNGGLFNPTRHAFLESKKIGNDVLTNIINTLTRTTERERITYQDLAIQHLGNIYEGLLEYEPSVEGVFGKVQLIRNKNKRKASGSYYTSDAIVRLMVENALDPFCKHKTFEDILRIKVLDPAMGSGHFLVGVIDHLALELATHPNAPAMTAGDDDTEIAYWRRRVVENCIYGVDINPMTVELAKVSLWLHTVAKGEPLSFLDHHIRCGNSLIGANISDLAHLPTPTKRRANETSQIVVNMDFGFTLIVSEAVGHYLVIEKMESQTADDIHTMEQKLEQAQQTLSRHKEVANLWLSVHFGNRVERGDYHAILDTLSSHQTDIPTNLHGYQKAQELADHYRYFHWEIEFPEVFRDESGNKLENPGFDVIVGNPPYSADLDPSEKNYLKTIVKETKNWTSAAFFIDIAKNRLMKSDGILAFIVPKSLLFVENWHSLMFALLDKTRVLIDVGEAFKDAKVNLEQAIFIRDSCYAGNFYTAHKFINETWVRKTHISHSYPEQFQAWIHDVSREEIQLASKLNQIGTFMGDISDTKRGLPWQRLLSESGDIPVIGGDNIVRYGLDSIKGFIGSENLDPSNEKVEFLQNPKVMSQKIIAHIQNPKPHIKITATVDQTGDILNVDTVINTVLTDKNFSSVFVSAILNSDLINWYAYKFIFSSAIRSMTFDKYYVGKIPIPIATVEEQQPIIELVEQIMEAKQENPKVNQSTEEKRIDELIYDLYRLTPSEKEVVRSSIGQSKKS